MSMYCIRDYETESQISEWFEDETDALAFWLAHGLEDYNYYIHHVEV